MPHIIYLNGPSSVGKTTLSHALQEVFNTPYLHLSMDRIIGLMPSKVNNWEGERAVDGFYWKRDKDPTGQPIYRIQQGAFAKKITRTMKEVAQLLAFEGYDFIIDDVTFGAVGVQEWKEALAQYTVLYVGVVAPLDVLEERERLRGDRIIGSARAQYFEVHENVSYDLEIDTHASSIEENVELIQKALRASSR